MDNYDYDDELDEDEIDDQTPDGIDGEIVNDIPLHLVVEGMENKEAEKRRERTKLGLGRGRGKLPMYEEGEVVEALKRSGGQIVIAAQILGVTRQTIYNYIDKYDLAQEEIRTQHELTFDMAQKKLRDAIVRGEPWAIKFALNSPAAAARGFYAGMNLNLNVDVGKMTDEELIKIVNGYRNGTS